MEKAGSLSKLLHRWVVRECRVGSRSDVVRGMAITKVACRRYDDDGWVHAKGLRTNVKQSVKAHYKKRIKEAPGGELVLPEFWTGEDHEEMDLMIYIWCQGEYERLRL